MISPTIGRVVWYHPPMPHDQPWAALVVYVHSDARVNLVAFNENGNPQPKDNVQLVQGSEEHEPAYCEWMPYQKGQAAKTEAAEAKISG